MINIALIQPNVILDWEKGSIARIEGLVNKTPELNHFKIVNRVADAELVVILESCILKTQRNIRDFERMLYLNEDNRRLCTLNYEDSPPGFLPGLYSSLETFKFDPSIHISWPHLVLPNEQINEVNPGEELPVTMLFTFSGSCSNPIRREIFDLYKSRPGKYKINEVKKWYNHNLSEKKSYINDIRQSKFVLCPKGIASYSHRITETLALKKVPVVIADDWVPFSIPEKDYFVRVKEIDLPNLVQILEKKEEEYEKLRAAAVNVYTKYFDPLFCYSIAFNQLADLYATQLLNISSAFIRHRWHSRKFWKKNKWCIEDRVARKIGKIVNSLSN